MQSLGCIRSIERLRSTRRLQPYVALKRAGAAGLLAFAGLSFDAAAGELGRPFVPAVSMEKDGRSGLADFARRAGLAAEDVRRRFHAMGLVRCGAATGTGQLTLRDNVITTAAHVLIDQFGKRRIGCVFEPMMGAPSGPVPLDYDSIKTGSTMPLAHPATRDWAVARLVAPVSGPVPYGLATSPAAPAPILMCAGGNRAEAAIGVERCSIRHVIGTSSDGIRELAIDCNAGPGSSGAALLFDDKIYGIYVGYRSSAPKKAQAFSERHYNFAISIDGPFRRALLSAAGQ